MSIRDEAYRLCKTVWASPSRAKLRDLIHGIDRVADEDRDTEKDRSHLGYLARSLHAQVLGYLVVDQRRAELEQDPYPQRIRPLFDSERQFLAGVHRQILLLNEQCIAPLVAQLPRSAAAVDPYAKFGIVTLTGTHNGDILTTQAIDAMARSFHQHPAIVAALEIPKGSMREMTANQLIGAVQDFTTRLVESGPRNTPESLKDIIFKGFPGAGADPNRDQKNALYRAIGRHLLALTCIRDSLVL